MKIINQTQCLCAVCERVIPAEIYEQNGRIFIKGKCEVHGEQISDHVWDDPEIYAGMQAIKTNPGGSRQIVVDVTRKCNLNCKVCFANANQYQGNQFMLEDIDRTKEYSQVFLSGGEPTTHQDIFKIIRKLVSNKQKPILFTNGVKLANRSFVRKLSKAGLRSVLLQLDTLKSSDSQYIRRGNLTTLKLKALKNLAEFNIPTSVWTVVVRGKNLKDIRKIHARLFKFPNIKTVSAIPIWRVGRFEEKDFEPPSTIIKELCQIYGLETRDFVETTRFVCDIDRFFSIFDKNRGRLFGKCMSKALVFKFKNKYISIGKIFDLEEINRRLDTVLDNRDKRIFVFNFFTFLVFNQFLLNFFRNKYFRAVVWKFFVNLRYLFNKKFLMISPFRFITVGIFPNAKNIDLDFIEPCNSYAYGCDDYAFRPACLHYINLDRKQNSK